MITQKTKEKQNKELYEKLYKGRVKRDKANNFIRSKEKMKEK